MSEFTVDLKLDVSDIEELVSLCKEQAELIKDLHERVHSTKLDKRVADMFEVIGDMKLDVLLRKIKAEEIKDAITYSAIRDNHQKTSYWAYGVMSEYADKLERGEL